MVDRIQGNSNIREGIFAGSDSAQSQGFRPFRLAEILARLAQGRIQSHLDEVISELSRSDTRLADISKRIQQLIILYQTGSQEIARAVKEVENDPSFADWELHLITFLKEHRFRRMESILSLDDQKAAQELAKQLAGQVGKVTGEMLTARQVFQEEGLPPKDLQQGERRENALPEPVAPPAYEPFIAIQAAPMIPIASVAAPMENIHTLPSYEHRYKKMDAELGEVQRSLQQLRSSIKVIQEGQHKSRPLIKRLFAILATLFGRIFSPRMHSGRKIVEVSIKKYSATSA